MKLLLAEDDRDLSAALKTLLERSGYMVDAVYDGEDAVDYAAAENYDAIIMDWMMPKTDGVQALKKIHNSDLHFKDYNAFELKDALVSRDLLKANRIVKYIDNNPRTVSLYSFLPQLFKYFQNLMVAHFAKNYFKHELEDGTPFTMRGAKELMRLGIIYIAVNLGVSIVAGAVFAIASKSWELPEKAEFQGMSIGLGIIFIIVSLICRYGAELTEGKTEAAPAVEAAPSTTEAPPEAAPAERMKTE